MERHLPVSLLLLLFSIYLLPGFCCAAGNDHFVFSGFDVADASSNFTLDGEATISSERLLELTNNGDNVEGHAFYRTPFRFKESPNGTVLSFSATFVFAIISGLPGPDTITTDGMAFLISPTTNLSDATGAQYMGFLDSVVINRIFAVELDTIKNTEMQDIDDNHVGINIASRYSVPAHAAGFYDGKDDGTFNNLSLDSGKAMQVWVEYDGKTKQVDVTMAPVGMDKPSKPLLSNISDLSAVLTEEAYVGFSAATGPMKSRHCVLAWSFAMNGSAPLIDYNKIPKLPSDQNTLSKLLKIVLPIVASVLIVAADLQTTHVVGTMGYIAPELARSGKASPLTDVFAFGTFLLEVTCGRRPVCNTVQHGRKLLVDRVLEYWNKGALMETVDPKMLGNYNREEARLVLTLGLMCSHPFPRDRPTMRQVIQYLDGDAPLPELTVSNLSLLSMMQSEGLTFNQSSQQYPWSGISMATMTPDITEGR
ncbi:hypothetical protein PR202_gb12178 [Eleusine coracana subsp. coracana]|uniref:non-specific serine/threonine protein kinase n=1 Tax=Eleusine coracana subsp. coracana TaxID=191504 RepID=A0AAV5EP72_ELECO|nr:hypothetical protein PR202_gb12178 [Eleusine coracana subsp. coracana]